MGATQSSHRSHLLVKNNHPSRNTGCASTQCTLKSWHPSGQHDFYDDCNAVIVSFSPLSLTLFSPHIQGFLFFTEIFFFCKLPFLSHVTDQIPLAWLVFPPPCSCTTDPVNLSVQQRAQVTCGSSVSCCSTTLGLSLVGSWRAFLSKRTAGNWAACSSASQPQPSPPTAMPH